MDDDPTAGREIVIRNLNPKTTPVSLEIHFWRYGPVKQASVVPYKTIGFVLFERADSASAVLRESHQFVDGWPVSCRLSSHRPLWEDQSGRKVVIWGIPPGLSTERFVEFFRQFGEIEAGPLGLYKETGALKPTVALVYKTERGARDATRRGVWHSPEATFYCKMYTKQAWKEALDASLAQGQGNPGRIMNPSTAFLGQHYGGSAGAGYNQNRQFRNAHPFLGEHRWPRAGFGSRPRQSHNAQLQRVAGRGAGGTGVYLGGAQGPTEPMMALPPSVRGYQAAGFGGGGGGGSGPIVPRSPSPRPQYQQMGGYRPPGFNAQRDFRDALPFGRGGVRGSRRGGYHGGR